MTFSHYDFEYIDIHTHFFPPQVFKAIWNYFENLSHKLFKDWSIKYKFPADDLVKILKQNNVKAFTTFNYAHKSDVAHFINEWTKKFTDKYKNAIPFGCVWPEDKDRVDYVRKIIDDYGFYGIKIQPLVQNFYPNDDRMDEVYELILDRGKWICFHAGTAPYRNQYVGYKNFIKFVNK